MNNNSGGSSDMMFMMLALVMCACSMSALVYAYQLGYFDMLLTPASEPVTSDVVAEAPVTGGTEEGPETPSTGSNKKKKSKGGSGSGGSGSGGSGGGSSGSSTVPVNTEVYIYMAETKNACPQGHTWIAVGAKQCAPGIEVELLDKTRDKTTTVLTWRLEKAGSYYRIKTGTKCSNSSYLYLTACAKDKRCTEPSSPPSDYTASNTGPRLQEKAPSATESTQLWKLEGSSSKGWYLRPKFFLNNSTWGANKILGSWCKPGDTRTWFGSGKKTNNLFKLRRKRDGYPPTY